MADLRRLPSLRRQGFQRADLRNLRLTDVADLDRLGWKRDGAPVSADKLASQRHMRTIYEETLQNLTENQHTTEDMLACNLRNAYLLLRTSENLVLKSRSLASLRKRDFSDQYAARLAESIGGGEIDWNEEDRAVWARYQRERSEMRKTAFDWLDVDSTPSNELPLALEPEASRLQSLQDRCAALEQEESRLQTSINQKRETKEQLLESIHELRWEMQDLQQGW
jgi:hypothetical protein